MSLPPIPLDDFFKNIESKGAADVLSTMQTKLLSAVEVAKTAYIEQKAAKNNAGKGFGAPEPEQAARVAFLENLQS
ncbi:hypothetical protein [Gimesia sp.]|uniref:hypothetical protein n=1 Tax=Gimesia sp. TaxID=2024833 RepID=UPI003A94A55A